MLIYFSYYQTGHRLQTWDGQALGSQADLEEVALVQALCFPLKASFEESCSTSIHLKLKHYVSTLHVMTDQTEAEAEVILILILLHQCHQEAKNLFPFYDGSDPDRADLFDQS